MSKLGKYFLLATGFALLATFARIPGAVIKVHAHDGACSVASLKGTYAWRRTGANKSMGGPVAEMGLDFFNGDGKRGITRSTGTSYPAILRLDQCPVAERKLHGRSGLYRLALRCKWYKIQQHHRP